ncbi:hypothetical protein VPH35_038692 [Triticum aestivum]
MCMATWKWSQERPAETPSRRPAAECSGATRCAPVGDTMPSPRRTAVGLHCTKKSGGLSMENGEEGCTPPPPQPPMSQTLRSLSVGKTAYARRPWGKQHAQDPRRSGRDRGPLRSEAQLGGAAAASPAHANALGGRAQQPAASPPPTRGG